MEKDAIYSIIVYDRQENRPQKTVFARERGIIVAVVDTLRSRQFKVTEENGRKEEKEEKGLNPKFYKWYLDLRESNPLPHGGFGLGIERLVRWIANERDITYTVPFPNKPYSPNRSILP